MLTRWENYRPVRRTFCIFCLGDTSCLDKADNQEREKSSAMHEKLIVENLKIQP